MNRTPKANRLQIAIFGRTNVGKSSLLNLMSGQDVAITSPLAGTTTDVVEKAAELLPLGPVLFLDTAGLDDRSELSGLRLKKTEKIFDRADVAILVLEPDTWTGYEEAVLKETGRRNIPILAVINKIDIRTPSEEFLRHVEKRTGCAVQVSSIDKTGRDQYITELKKRLVGAIPADSIRVPSLIGDLVSPGGLVLLVVPIDLQAPRGRLILPQVQTIRDALDHDAAALIVKERELAALLSSLNRRPEIVVCDSQAILKVTADIPKDMPCTTFSILFARQKGDLVASAEGAARLDELKPGDRVLIAEACTHHALEDDIGRVKIPRWLRQYAGGELSIDVCSGRDYPEDLAKYRIIIHCGACMLTRTEMIHRIRSAAHAGVPVTNYGLAISFLQGVARKVLAPFPAALLAFDKKISASRTADSLRPDERPCKEGR
ncbi:MAG: [FeFe] hydrogenase H-cluster maturation GTPase HydF [Syntrophales bacterium]